MRNHLKLIHKVCFTNSAPKQSKAVVSQSKPECRDVALGGPLLNDMFTDSSDLQQFDIGLDQNLLLDNDNLTVENLLSENVKDLDHFNFEIDDNQKQFICDICLKQFTKVKLLIIHLRHHTGDFMCTKCLKIFCRKENLKSHICNTNNLLNCDLCGRNFTQRKYLSRHMEAIHKKKYRCVSCNKHYYSNKELQEHNCSKVPLSEKERYSCHICDKLFYREIYLKRHLKTHKEKTRISKHCSITCDVCGMYLVSSSYYSHKKKHGEPTYTCEICNKKFYRSDILKEHQIIHQADIQFECNICYKKYKSQKILNVHMKHHNNAKAYKCSECDAAYNVRPSLIRHIRKFHEKTSEKKPENTKFYNCPVCHKSIKLRSSLLRHLRRAHQEVTNIDLSAIRPVKQNVEDTSNEIEKLLNHVENNTKINKNAVDSLVEELDIDKDDKEAKQVCLSIPELTDNYQEITLGRYNCFFRVFITFYR